MASSSFSPFHLDPDHISCIGGRTVQTCRGCAGNAPRGAVCPNCDGRGFNIFICAHCNPAVAITASRPSNPLTSVTTNTTPGSSVPSSPCSLSRSPSTSYQSQSDNRSNKAWRRHGDGRDGANCGRVEASTRRNI